MNNLGILLPLGLLAAVAAASVLAIRRDCRHSGNRLSTYLGFRALWLICKLWHGVRPRGPDPLPPRGSVILVSNHTSPADPMFLQCCSRRLISFLMAKEYASSPWFQPVFRLSAPILVNRTGRDTAATKAALRALGEGRVIGIFPEGGIHLDPNSLGKAKPGAALLALVSRATVVPAFIDRPFHSNRMLAGLLRPARTRIFFGSPIDLSQFHDAGHDRQVLREVTRLLMQSIEQLRPAQSPRHSWLIRPAPRRWGDAPRSL